MAFNKVTVRIYGQEYNIVGERDEETISEIAEYVDDKIKETAKVFNKSVSMSQIPILAAVNIADDYFQSKDEIKSLEIKVNQLEKDCGNYLRMWEEAKKSFVQFKEGASKASIDASSLEDKINELEKKCQEFESSYFELVNENMKLKEEIEVLKQGNDY